MVHYHASFAKAEPEEGEEPGAMMMTATDERTIARWLRTEVRGVVWEIPNNPANEEKLGDLREFLDNPDFPASWRAEIGPFIMHVFRFTADWCEITNGDHKFTCWGAPADAKNYPGLVTFGES